MRDAVRFARFAAVGVLQNGVNVAAFALAFHGGVPYLAAALLAAALALALSFVLNRSWTFGASGGVAGPAVRYTIVFAGAVAAGLAILTALVEIAGVHPVVAQVLAILIVAPASFLAQRGWVFGEARSGRERVW